MRGEIMRQKSILSQISPVIISQGKSKLFKLTPKFSKYIFYNFDSFNLNLQKRVDFSGNIFFE